MPVKITTHQLEIKSVNHLEGTVVTRLCSLREWS